ncbi:MAG: hypothetical protein QM504_05235 [Pseudomonadota bacterium]
MEIITLKCKACSVEKEFKVGREASEKSLDNAMEHFKGKTKLHIKSLQKKHKIDKSEFGYAIYACPKCHTLRNPYTVEVEYDQLMVFKPFYKCQECNSSLVKALEPIEEYSCSACGNEGLQQV